MTRKKKRKKLTKKTKVIIYVILYLGFIALMDYNFIARIHNDNASGEVVDGYPIDVDGKESEIEAARNAAEEFNAKMANSTYPTLANPTSLKQVPYGEYESILNLREDGTIGTIQIPAIDVNLPIYHGTTEESLQKGAGHIQGTSFPIGGESTHSSISAHCGLPDKTMFTHLSQLVEGDRFFVNVLDETLEYEVYQIDTVLPADTSKLAIQPGEDICTLVTCTPYGVNSHRLLVHGKRIVPFQEEDLKEVPAKPTFWITKNWWILATILFLLMGAGTITVYLKVEEEGKENTKRKKKKRRRKKKKKGKRPVGKAEEIAGSTKGPVGKEKEEDAGLKCPDS